ncbi:MAG: alpha/beta fold hydrolase [Pseudomonadota bacterium]
MSAQHSRLAEFAASGAFTPPAGLRHFHVQTVGSSLLLRTPTLAHHGAEILTTDEGVRLQAWLSQPRHRMPARRVILLHGWLGHAGASYICALAEFLEARGYGVVRLNLRDHGDTSHLNEDVFHSARLREVSDACALIGAGAACAVIGFSLGGNFALRVSAAIGLPALGICPAVDPAASCTAIDTGPAVYRHYFLRKWRRALAAKQRAFPQRYDFVGAAEHRSVLNLTDYFCGGDIPYPDSATYFAAYRVKPEQIADAPVALLASRDDSIVPSAGVEAFRDHAPVVLSEHGGHCGYLPRHWLHERCADFLRLALSD